MTDSDRSFKRWYDEDPVVSRCIKMLECIQDSLKRQTATFLMNEIISKPPYVDMLPDEIISLIGSEDRKRRWYDFDEIMRIFLELLRHSSVDTRKKIAVEAITFIEDFSFDKTKSIEIEVISEDELLEN
ncbi:MAG: hypothetical protein A2287_05740 [Candidatus Melainabacteria bacterium RIFOXYA12_FULL_32_12]|nr:MAG: hypothetical protein A2104_07795 [Candidatus Melainabacteria bacterium GWF2_32_7]OGI21732.1 MAG: hypothetical protein A2255_07360 [Candidatus Melainabacteria bacterium RIFOXYA2_FULL_32_9]OGI30749.1 MAG: hypothetical protein A2287_05740 [Candidatus Melainabacteria bacterium RIFOXYA12_FULL_32_12]